MSNFIYFFWVFIFLKYECRALTYLDCDSGHHVCELIDLCIGHGFLLDSWFSCRGFSWSELRAFRAKFTAHRAIQVSLRSRFGADRIDVLVETSLAKSVAAIGLDTVRASIYIEANTATVRHLGLQLGFFECLGLEFG